MLEQAQKQALEKLLSAGQILDSPAQLAAYMLDAGMVTGIPDAVILVNDTVDLQALARWASEMEVAITARGAGTGYTGGSVASSGVMVSFARLNKLLEVDETSRMAVVQPGLSNEALQRQLQPLDLFYPPDPASLSVCTLGGNIAENAGGPHCLKYGVTSNYVLGLQVVLPGGEVIRLGGKSLDPPEYDFTSILTGSEGTLALISEATLRLRRPFEGVQALTASFASVAQAGAAVSAVIAASLLPATIELMDVGMINIVEDYLSAGLPRDAGAMLIIDVEGYTHSLEEQLDEVAAILNRFLALEVKLARTPQERELIWRARRSAAGAIGRISPNEYLVDVSVPRSKLSEVLLAIQGIARDAGYRVCFLAHAGDGNLHPNLLCDFSIPGEQERVLKAGGEILKLCASMGGSIGGEHGIGVDKRDYLPFMYSPGEMRAMLEVKELFDPQGLMNPGKIFPSDFPPVVAQARQEQSLIHPESTFIPASALEAADGLRALQESGLPAYLLGGGTHWRGVSSKEVIISSSGLQGIVQLATEDMYVTVRAGTPIPELQNCLAEKGFWVPVSASFKEATIGGAVAANVNSPLRSLYGSLRDQVLALQVALPDGRLLSFGRSLVKDVAGYQMSKLFVGSYGTLGMIAEVTLKLHPLPRARRSLVWSSPDLATGIAWGQAVMRLAVVCSGIVLLSEPEEGCRLIYTAEGHPADVSAELQLVRQSLTSRGVGDPVETDEMNASGEWDRISSSADFVARMGMPAGDLLRKVSNGLPFTPRDRFAADLLNGIILVGSVPDKAPHLLSSLRQTAGQQGYAIMQSGPRSFLHREDAWGEPPASHKLMRGLKQHWDPANILNRDEFIRWL